MKPKSHIDVLKKKSVAYALKVRGHIIYHTL